MDGHGKYTLQELAVFIAFFFHKKSNKLNTK